MHPVSFAIIGIVALAFGLVTPPYGLCLMISCAIAKVRLRYALKDTMIMLVPMLLVLAMLIIWPEIPLFLPRLIRPEFLQVARRALADAGIIRAWLADTRSAVARASGSKPRTSTCRSRSSDDAFAELERRVLPRARCWCSAARRSRRAVRRRSRAASARRSRT